jgi:hypothetical protein
MKMKRFIVKMNRESTGSNLEIQLLKLSEIEVYVHVCKHYTGWTLTHLISTDKIARNAYDRFLAGSLEPEGLFSLPKESQELFWVILRNHYKLSAYLDAKIQNKKS